MTSTSSANDTALPSITEPPRRSFLRQLASLPLIGGGVKLLGQPTASAEPITPDLIEAYKTWLDEEHRFLCWEMAADPFFRSRYLPIFPEGPGITPIHGPTADRVAYYRSIKGSRHHVGQAGHYHSGGEPSPSTRAALVLSAVGCDWRDGKSRDRRRA